MSSKRSRFLTPGMERVLRWMAADGEERELVTEAGEAWYGHNRTSIATVNRLLRLCLLHDDGGDGAMGDEKFRRYSLNEEGYQIVTDPEYVPLIVKHLSSEGK